MESQELCSFRCKNNKWLLAQDQTLFELVCFAFFVKIICSIYQTEFKDHYLLTSRVGMGKLSVLFSFLKAHTAKFLFLLEKGSKSPIFRTIFAVFDEQNDVTIWRRPFLLSWMFWEIGPYSDHKTLMECYIRQFQSFGISNIWNIF